MKCAMSAARGVRPLHRGIPVTSRPDTVFMRPSSTVNVKAPGKTTTPPALRAPRGRR